MSSKIEKSSPGVGDENDDAQTEVTTVKAACKKAEQHEAQSEKAEVLQPVTRLNIDSKLETHEKELDNSGASANPMREISQDNATGGTLDSTGGNHSAAADLKAPAESHLQERSKSALKYLSNSASKLEEAFGLVDANCNEPRKKMEENSTGGTLDSTGGNHTEAADLKGPAEANLQEFSKSLLKGLRNKSKTLAEASGLVDANCDERSKKMEENATGGTPDSTGENNTADDILKHVEGQIKSVAKLLDIIDKDLQGTQEQVAIAATYDGLSKKKTRSDVLDVESETQQALNNMEKLSADQANLLAMHVFNLNSLIEELTSVAKQSAEKSAKVNQLAEKMKAEYSIDEVTDNNNEEEDFPRSESKLQ